MVSELNLSIFGGILPEGVAFLGFVLISFSISDTLIASNLKDFSFPILFLMSNILGWISYFLISLSTGSKIVQVTKVKDTCYCRQNATKKVSLMNCRKPSR